MSSNRKRIASSRREGRTGGTITALASVLCLALFCAVVHAGESAESEPLEERQETQEAPGDESRPYPVSGALDLSFRYGTGAHDTDADLIATATFSAGDSFQDTLTGSLSAIALADLDGGQDTYGFFGFDSPEDSFDSSATGRLLHAYIDVNRVMCFDRIRLGRQTSGSVEIVRFDGVRIDTVDLTGWANREWKLTAHAFAGVPVHFWEPSPAGDACGGAGCDLAYRRVLRLGLQGLMLRDRAEAWGFEETTRNTLLALTGSWFPVGELTVRGHLTFLNVGTSDLQLRPADLGLSCNGRVSDWGLTAGVDFTARLVPRDDPAAELNPYDAVTGQQKAFQRGRAILGWEFAKGIEVEVGADFYNVTGEPAPYDTDMVGAHATVRARDLPVKQLGLSVTAETWEPSGAVSRQGLQAEARYLFMVRGGERERRLLDFRLGAGLNPFSYERNEETIREKVLCFRFEARWWPWKNVYCGVAYRFENDEFDAYSRITVRVGVQF